MEQEVADYLIREYSDKVPSQEQLAYKHLLYEEKLAAMDNVASHERYLAAMLRVGWLSDDEEILALLQDGWPDFRRRIAHKIYSANGGDALLNKCPNCQRLARTSRAKQCRHDWH